MQAKEYLYVARKSSMFWKFWIRVQHFEAELVDVRRLWVPSIVAKVVNFKFSVQQKPRKLLLLYFSCVDRQELAALKDFSVEWIGELIRSAVHVLFFIWITMKSHGNQAFFRNHNKILGFLNHESYQGVFISHWTRIFNRNMWKNDLTLIF